MYSLEVVNGVKCICDAIRDTGRGGGQNGRGGGQVKFYPYE